MAGLNETNKWETEIYRIEENDPVHGGEDGITNKPIKQLANRTKYLKTEVEKRYIAQNASTEQTGLVQLDSNTDSDAEDKAATPKAVNVVKALVIAVRNALNNYIPNSKKSNADNSSSSDTIATSYALKKVRDIATKRATDTTAGQTVLSHKTNGTDKSKSASEFALGELNKELAGKGVPLGAVVSFPKGMNPRGYLRAIGGTFNRATYPDLYVANGNSDILPNLHRSDVGMTAYFAVDNIPNGWIAFDSIRTTVTQQNYPEL
ncbi:phage tail protein, partial [Haemophilus influenzae]